MSNVKVLLCEDKETGKIIGYRCKKREMEPFETDCYFSSLYGMKLNSSVVNGEALKKGNGTNDLIRELRMILEDEESSVIDFGNVLNLFNMNKVNPCVIREPIKRFLGLYEVEKVSEYVKTEWVDRIKEKISSSRKPLSLESEKAALKSITPNTQALENINLRNYEKRK